MILLDYRDKRPLYEQIVEKFEHLFICGALPAGTKLPSVRSLAVDLSINPNTIQRAYSILEANGYIYTVVGRGNFVAEKSQWKVDKQKELLSEIEKLIYSAKESGISVEQITELSKKIYSNKEVNHDSDK